jgi:RNA polymerase sigma factor (sigma-70 family)
MPTMPVMVAAVEKPDPSSDSGALLQAAQKGQDSALAMLLARHLVPLRAFVRLQITPFLRAREAESDILQSVCHEVIRQQSHFEYRGEAEFRSWLYRAVLNKVRDQERHYKAQKRAPARGFAPDDGALAAVYHSVSPSRVAMAAEQLGLVEEAFTRLPERYARALTLHHFVGLDRGELAKEMQMTPEAVSVLLRRAMVRLSRELGGEAGA